MRRCLCLIRFAARAAAAAPLAATATSLKNWSKFCLLQHLLTYRRIINNPSIITTITTKMMYKCINCNTPSGLSWVCNHDCFLHYDRIFIDEYNYVNGIQAPVNIGGEQKCLQIQEKTTEKAWNSVVAAFENNRDMLRDTADTLSISRLNASWAQLDEQLHKYAEGSLQEWKETIKDWTCKTVAKWQILEPVLLSTDHQLLDLFFTDAEMRYLHLMDYIKQFSMNIVEILTITNAVKKFIVFS